MSKHTPGPWATYGPPQNPKDPDDTLDVAIEIEIDGKPRILAECYGRVGETIYLDAKANARLIAAAPEMLEALELISDELDAFPNDENNLQFNIAMKSARSAIAKATGKS